MSEQPFKVGQRVRRKKTGETGKVVGSFQLKKDKYANRLIRGRWKWTLVQAKGSWMHKIEWDDNASIATKKYKNWMAVGWLVAIDE